MVWGVPQGHEKLLRKGHPQGARLRLGQAPFHGFRVSQRDVKSCLEKFRWASLRLAHPTRLFMVSGCPKGHEQLFRKDSLSREDAFFDVEEREEVPMGHKLLRKELMGCAALHPSYGSFHGFRVS